MAKSVPLLKRMHEENVEALIPKVILPDGPEWEETKDRILCMGVDLASADTAEQEYYDTAVDPEDQKKDDGAEEEMPALEDQ